MNRNRILAAALQGVFVLLTGLLIYDRPPDLAAFWHPFIQGALAMLTALGVNAGVRQVTRKQPSGDRAP